MEKQQVGVRFAGRALAERVNERFALTDSEIEGRARLRRGRYPNLPYGLIRSRSRPSAFARATTDRRGSPLSIPRPMGRGKKR